MKMIRNLRSRRSLRRAIRHYVEVEYPETDRRAAYFHLAREAGL